MQFTVKGSDDYVALRSALRSNVCRIIFYKKNGDVRAASGTTDLARIPTNQHPKGKRGHIESTVAFYDLDKEEWRSFCIENLIGYSVEE